MIVHSVEEINGLKKAGKIAAICLDEMKKAAVPGITTKQLDNIARKIMLEHGANSAPETYYNFPGATCISVNNVIAHGIPSNYQIKSGDLINIDVSVEKDGYFADNGASILIDSDDPKLKELLRVTEKALDNAAKVLKKPDVMIQEIANAYEDAIKNTKFKLLLNLCGHGVGRKLHEEPLHVPNLYTTDTRRLSVGTVVALEPFITTGPAVAQIVNSKWEYSLSEGHYGAQFEHTFIISNGDPVILTKL